MPIGKPFLQMDMQITKNETFYATFERNLLVSANLCLKTKNLVTKENGRSKTLIFLSAWEQLFEAIPQLVINGYYISRQEETPILSILSAVASGVSILFFFVTLPCKMKDED